MYFPKEKTRFFSSGCPLLDCVLGGGWALNRLSNIVGDRSSGKTLLATEGMINFKNKFENSDIFFTENEKAFDEYYAENIGLDMDKINFFKSCETVESWFEHLTDIVENRKKRNVTRPCLYVLDSLDSLSDKAEQERGINTGSYGTKPKQLSEFFRVINPQLSDSNITLMIISQLRDNIGVSFGEKKKKSGGNALNFFISQELWLSERGKIVKERGKIKRTVGIKVKALCKKNKVGVPFRDCEFPILFNWGMDDITAGLEWLKSIDKLGDLTNPPNAARIPSFVEKIRSNGSLADYREELSEIVKINWEEIEENFSYSTGKYS